jgi:AcrR family transcriptional regulator
MGDARSELLARIVDEVARHGIGDRSLRDLAAAVGSSHRMLLYHFGSREGLVGAIVVEVEARQRSLMSGADPTTGEVAEPVDVVRDVWKRVSDPQMRPFVQLFFEAVAYSSRWPAESPLGDDGEVTQIWIDEVDTMSHRIQRPTDAIEVRLGIAVIRGLLLDVIAGGDLDGATASLERFLSMWVHVGHGAERRAMIST